MAIDTTTSVDIKTLTPFKKFIMTIGLLPTSYLESMTYAELVMWFCNFLQEQVIPTVNNNAEAVQELQNWFNNLDVQDEIDHKLDEMVESGQLQEIIAEYLNANALWSYDNVQSMKESTNLINGSFAKTLGYYSANDGGKSLYKISDIANSNIHQETLNNGLYANLITNEVDIRQLGAKGDDSTDNTNIIQEAITKYNNIIIQDGTYIIDGIISLTDNLSIKGNGTIKSKNNLTLSQNNGNMLLLENLKNISINGITFDGNKANITGTYENYHKAIYIINCENIKIENCNFKNFYHQSIQVASKRIGQADETLPGVNHLLINNCNSNYTLCLLQVTNSISNDIKVLNCIALNCGEHGVVFYKKINNIYVENCYIDTTGLGGGTSNTGHGIRLYENNNVYILNNIIKNTAGNGITGVIENKTTNTHIINNIIDTVGSANHGIYLHGDYSSVNNNKIYNVTETSINIEGDYNIIEDNEIKTTKLGISNVGNYNKLSTNIIDTCSYRGSNINNSSNTSIFNNTFLNITDYDCYITSTCTDSMISLNNGTIVNRGTIKQEVIS